MEPTPANMSQQLRGFGAMDVIECGEQVLVTLAPLTGWPMSEAHTAMTDRSIPVPSITLLRVRARILRALGDQGVISRRSLQISCARRDAKSDAFRAALGTLIDEGIVLEGRYGVRLNHADRVPREGSVIDLPDRASRHFGNDVRARVWAQTNGRCWYCGKLTNPYLDFDIDHIEPIARGGNSDENNLVPSCSSCNHQKHTRSVESFRLDFAPGHRFAFETDLLSDACPTCGRRTDGR